MLLERSLIKKLRDTLKERKGDGVRQNGDGMDTGRSRHKNVSITVVTSLSISFFLDGRVASLVRIIPSVLSFNKLMRNIMLHAIRRSAQHRPRVSHFIRREPLSADMPARIDVPPLIDDPFDIMQIISAI
jgi:hypothetical protein